MSPKRAATALVRDAIRVDYGEDLETEIGRLRELIERNETLAARHSPRWLAIKLLEGDQGIEDRIGQVEGSRVVLQQAAKSTAHLRSIYGEDADTLIADGRYGWINGLVHETVTRPGPDASTLSERVDRVLTNRLLGLPIFFLLMWAVFRLTTDLSAPYLDWVAAVISGPVTRWAAGVLAVVGLGETWVESLVLDGVLAGVGGVMVFVPVLMFLYLALAILEDSGYMARAAFVMDRVMRTLGLHGTSTPPARSSTGATGS
jgi:ferrous iron transport protein B